MNLFLKKIVFVYFILFFLIYRYKMLLQDLVNNTDESHPDKEGLQLAHDKVAELASWINEKKREFENKNRGSFFYFIFYLNIFFLLFNIFLF